MLENNLIFSLITSLIISITIYGLRFRKDYFNENKKQEIILLFGVSFATIFLMRILSQNNGSVKTSSNISILTTKPPF